jgi:hypothetical protein
MEYFDGQTPEALVQEAGPLDSEQFLPILQIMAEGLQAAHAKGVLHRDIKPANVLVRPGRGPNDPWQVKIIDFGLALKHDLLADASSSTRHGKTVLGLSIAGTIDYAAPEQLGKLLGAKIGPPADVYGFGRTCCYALSGTPQPLRTHWRHVPEAVADLLEACLHEDPRQRLQDFRLVVQGLVEARDQAIPNVEPVEDEEDEEEYGDPSYYLGAGLELSARAETVGDQAGCCETLICVAQMVLATVALHPDVEGHLSGLVERAFARPDYAAQIRTLRTGFKQMLSGHTRDDLLDLPRRSDPPLQIIQRYIELAIEVGAPAYDSGDQHGCYQVYAALARAILAAFRDERDVCATLDKALKKSARQQSASTQAWTMRHAFDEVLTYD